MSILRNDAGEVRLAWRLILIILLFVAAEVLLRAIPMSLLIFYLTGNGITRTNALERASAIVYEDPVYSTVIGIILGIMGLFIVWFLVSVIEKSSFTWKTVGLDWKRNSLLAILLGALLALFLYIATLLTGSVLDSTAFSLIPLRMAVNVPVFFQKFVFFLAMGFGEEVVFRGYVQTRLVERFRASWGILITAVVFVLLHQLSYSLSPVIILSGIMLWTTIGALYYLSKSLYLVIVFHGVMNTLLNTMDFQGGDMSGMIVHALTLSLVIVVALVRSRSSRLHPNPI